MRNLTKFAGAVAVAITLTQTLQAIPVTGNIGFTGWASFNTGSTATATGVTSWFSPHVDLKTGNFTVIPAGTAVTFTAPWSFNSGASPFWSVSFGGQTFTFNLLASAITAQGGFPGNTGFVVVQGTGTVTGSGNTVYTATTMYWSFTASDPSMYDGPYWTFSASSSMPPPQVPDGASTAMLLSVALSGLTLLKRKFK